MDLGLKGKLALVTGGTAGIGLAIAEQLVKEGADVVVSSRNANNVSAAVERLNRLEGGKAEGLVMDLLSEDSVRKAIAQLKANPDILINNVGGPAAGKVLEIPLESWDRGYAALIRSVILVSQLVVPGMKTKKWGRVLTVTSTSAKEIIPALPVSGTFRAGLSAWTKSLAKEVGRDGVLVNNLLPGVTRTERLAELAHESPDFLRTAEARSGVGRIAEPAEIGRVAAFVCSNANTYMTGVDVLVDGGSTSAL